MLNAVPTQNSSSQYIVECLRVFYTAREIFAVNFALTHMLFHFTFFCRWIHNAAMKCDRFFLDFYVSFLFSKCLGTSMQSADISNTTMPKIVARGRCQWWATTFGFIPIFDRSVRWAVFEPYSIGIGTAIATMCDVFICVWVCVRLWVYVRQTFYIRKILKWTRRNEKSTRQTRDAQCEQPELQFMCSSFYLVSAHSQRHTLCTTHFTYHDTREPTPTRTAPLMAMCCSRCFWDARILAHIRAGLVRFPNCTHSHQYSGDCDDYDTIHTQTRAQYVCHTIEMVTHAARIQIQYEYGIIKKNMRLAF